MRTTRSRAAGLVLLAGLLTGCGGEGGQDGQGGQAAPDDATQEEFCDAYAGLFSNFGEMDPNDTSAGIRAFQDWAEEMEQVGTPEDIPEDARRGFEVMLDSIAEIDPEASEEELNRLGEDLSPGDQESGNAFVTWATQECPDAMKGMFGDLEGQLGELDEGELEDQLSELEGQLTESPG
ncbi:hypothetical protein [Nocardioides coralli]|uniref:hypothetical protein n=1 Tax=Nocardioides coralli TaxID=2872154 RepID=UPI001CA3BD8E|nr:hypothetical protein [Nocardioides coralli]QZY29246.1 hypothetical protein K6T13_00525 [Nocardioides coralli]